jgi:hypothetical protein
MIGAGIDGRIARDQGRCLRPWSWGSCWQRASLIRAWRRPGWRELYERTLHQAGLERRDIRSVIATGYGRQGVAFADHTVTEITCHARGVHHLMPDARTIIEIGGQDSKVIQLEDGGRVRDFAMNDRCAAGSGRSWKLLLHDWMWTSPSSAISVLILSAPC